MFIFVHICPQTYIPYRYKAFRVDEAVKRKSQVISFQRSLVPGNGSHADRNHHERAQQGVIFFLGFWKRSPFYNLVWKKDIQYLVVDLSTPSPKSWDNTYLRIQPAMGLCKLERWGAQFVWGSILVWFGLGSPRRIIVWETLLIQSAVQIHDVLALISQGVPPILISIFKRANLSLFGTILKIVDFECFFGFQRGHPTKWTFPWSYHEISSGICFLKISCCMIQHVPSHVHCANSRRWKRMMRHQRGPQRTIYEFFLEEFLILSYGNWLCFYARNLSKTL